MWAVNGPFPPVAGTGGGTARFRAGATIPVKFQLTGGTNLITTALAALRQSNAAACARLQRVNRPREQRYGLERSLREANTPNRPREQRYGIVARGGRSEGASGRSRQARAVARVAAAGDSDPLRGPGKPHAARWEREQRGQVLSSEGLLEARWAPRPGADAGHVVPAVVGRRPTDER